MYFRFFFIFSLFCVGHLQILKCIALKWYKHLDKDWCQTMQKQCLEAAQRWGKAHGSLQCDADVYLSLNGKEDYFFFCGKYADSDDNGHSVAIQKSHL